MPIVKFTPRALLVLADEPQIKGYVHPVRMAILRRLGAQPGTVTHLARELEVPPANLTHHFKLLVRVGLLRLVESRDTGRNLEKYYAAVARTFVVRPRTKSRVGKQALALSILRDNLAAAVERIQPGTARALALLASARVSERDLVRFGRRLEALVAQFRRADSERGRSYCLNLSLYADEAQTVSPRGVRVELR